MSVDVVKRAQRVIRHRHTHTHRQIEFGEAVVSQTVTQVTAILYIQFEMFFKHKENFPCYHDMFYFSLVILK